MDPREYVHSRLEETPILSLTYTRDEQKRRYSTRWAYIKLRSLADDFLSNKQPINNFVVFSGLRGIGKTTLIMQLYEHLRENKHVKKEHILYVSADELQAFLGCPLSKVLSSYIEDELKTTPISLSEKIFIFIDEAHFDKNWNTTIKALTDLSKNIFVIATGSSALLLEITTDSARRITRAPLFPLTFSEFQILKLPSFYPPYELSKDVRNLILNGNSDLIPVINKKYDLLKNIYHERKLNIDNELTEYFQRGGLAFTLGRTLPESYRKIMDIFDRIIKTDLPAFRPFEQQVLAKVFRLLGLISSKSAEISHGKLATELETSPDTINNLLDALEKTQVIFSIKPMMSSKGTKSWAGSPWKYYFLSPSLTYALRYTLGKTAMDSDTKGLLWENLVASTFFRLNATVSRQISIFYDRQDGGVDFLLQDEVTGKIIPVEVGLQKEKGQVEDAIKRFESDYGILISNFDKLFIRDKVIHIPFNVFLFA